MTLSKLPPKQHYTLLWGLCVECMHMQTVQMSEYVIVMTCPDSGTQCLWCHVPRVLCLAGHVTRVTRHTLLKYSALHNKLHDWCFQESLAATVRRARPPSQQRTASPQLKVSIFKKLLIWTYVCCPHCPGSPQSIWNMILINCSWIISTCAVQHLVAVSILLQYNNAMHRLELPTTASTAMACVRCVLASAVRLDTMLNYYSMRM